METHENGGRGSLLLIGVGIGVALGMLLAPRSGEELRQSLRDSTEKGREALKQHGEQITQTTLDMLDKGKDFIERQRDNLSGAVAAGKQAYREGKQSDHGNI